MSLFDISDVWYEMLVSRQSSTCSSTASTNLTVSISTSHTATMFILAALNKILADKDTKKSHNAQLKAACEAALKEIQEMIGADNTSEGDNVSISSSSVLPDPFQDATKLDADKYFLPFSLACQSKTPRLVVISLDGIQKLIAYGHLTGGSVSVENPAKRQIDIIVDTICNCFSGPHTDEGVQLQILKALLTILTSQHVEVHEASLLNSVRTCYNIYLASRNMINQTTAKVFNIDFIETDSCDMIHIYLGHSQPNVISNIFKNGKQNP